MKLLFLYPSKNTLAGYLLGLYCSEGQSRRGRAIDQTVVFQIGSVATAAMVHRWILPLFSERTRGETQPDRLFESGFRERRLMRCGIHTQDSPQADGSCDQVQDDGSGKDSSSAIV